jgi:cytochrome P450 family 4
MTVNSYCVAFCVVVLLFILAYIGWWIYIHTSPFHVAVNRIPGPKYLPLIRNALKLAGGWTVSLKCFSCIHNYL